MSNMSNNLLVCPIKLKFKKGCFIIYREIIACSSKYVNDIQRLKKTFRTAISIQIVFLMKICLLNLCVNIT